MEINKISQITAMMATCIIVAMGGQMWSAQKQSSQQSMATWQFISAADHAIYALGIERGLRTNHTSQNITNNTADTLLLKMELVDIAVDDLMSLLKKLNATPLGESEERLQSQWSSIKGSRNTNQTYDIKSLFDHYSRLNTTLLSMVNSPQITALVDAPDNSDKQLQQYLILAQLKEQLGKVRGYVHYLIGDGRVVSYGREIIIGFNSDIQATIQQLEDSHYPSHYITQLNQSLHAGNMDQTIASIISEDSKQRLSIDSKQWFDTQTQVIDDLHNKSLRLGIELENQLSSQIQQSQRQTYQWLALLLGLLMMVWVLQSRFAHYLKQRNNTTNHINHSFE